MQNINTNPLETRAPGTGGLSPRRRPVKPPGQVWRLVVALLEMPFRYLFGRDLFISYSRNDARKYAPNLALALQKRRPKLSFYLDRWLAPPSGKLPLSLRLQLRWSSILVVVCTERAVASPFVQDEVARFAEFGRKVLTVDVDGVFNEVRSQAPWVDVSGADPEEENGAAVELGEPSPNVVERILKMVEFTTQDRRLRRAVWGTLAFVLLSVGGIGAYGYNANKKATDAQARAAAANTLAVAAEGRARTASQQEASAKEAQRIAEQKERDANTKAAEADVLRAAAEKAQGIAEGLRDDALEKERAATAEAQKQQNIALARRLAAENNLAADPQSAEVEKKILLTVESMRRFPSLEAYSNLIEGIRTMPIPQASVSYPESVSGIALSPSGGQMATVAGGILWLRETALAGGGSSGEAQRLSPEGHNLTHDAGFSPDGKYLAAVDAGVVRLWLADGTRALEPIRGRSYLFSGDGGHIAVVNDDEAAGGELRSSVLVFRLEESVRREVAKVAPQGSITNISFSPDSTVFTTLTENDHKTWLNFWHTDGGTQTTPVKEPWRMEGLTLGAGFSPNAKYIWVTREGGDQDTQTLMRADTREVIFKNLGSHRFSPDGRFLVTATADSEYITLSGVEVWDASGERLEKLYSLRGYFGRYVFSRDGKYLAHSYDRVAVKVLNTLTGQVVAYVNTGPGYGGHAFTPDGRFLAVYAGKNVKLWPLSRDWKISEAEHERADMTALSPGGKLIAVSSTIAVSVIRADDGSVVWSHETPYTTAIAFDWEAGRLATGGLGNVYLWDARTGQPMRGNPPEDATGNEAIKSLAFSRDGKYLAVVGKTVEIREVVDSSKVVQINIEAPGEGTAHPSDVVFSPEGLLALAYPDSSSTVVVILDWRTRSSKKRVFQQLPGEDYNKASIAFDAEGHLVVADFYSAVIWDLKDEPRVVGVVELQAMRTETKLQSALSLDGRFIATTFPFNAENRSRAKTVVLELQPGRVIANACRRLSVRSLDEGEWQSEFGRERFRETCEGWERQHPNNDQR